MPLTLPTIDDRGYDAILAETLARIPVHNPEWTNFNDSDPGVTLLQLFAFMTDSLLYRANLIPERSRLKFLQLLDIDLRPPAAARGVVTVTNQRGPLETVTLPRDLRVSAGSVGFVTETGLDVLPVGARVFYRAPLGAGEERARAERLYTQLYGSDDEVEDPTTLDFYRTVELEPSAPGARVASLDLQVDTVDGTLWLALLARESDGAGAREAVREQIAEKTVSLGIAPAWDAVQRVMPPGRARSGAAQALAYDISTGAFEGDAPVYEALTPLADADPLEELALVQLTLPEVGGFGVWDDLDPTEDGVGELPPAVDDEALAERVLCWIRIRVTEARAQGEAPTAPAQTASVASGARFSWVGINAARVSQRVPVAPQRVGTGTGEPHQEVSLANTPVIPDTVTLTVDGVPWRRTDDLLAAPPEVPVGEPPAGGPRGDPRVYSVDREAGTLRFGSGLAGARPRAGAVIVAAYAWGGGRAGNVG
ncbi:MAG TPA: hypothetical protein VMK65_05470, partial [Longimicrobiales bacterium]|nr:hypothetical protein [Longimicrobiales bacterium]